MAVTLIPLLTFFGFTHIWLLFVWEYASRWVKLAHSHWQQPSHSQGIEMPYCLKCSEKLSVNLLIFRSARFVQARSSWTFVLFFVITNHCKGIPTHYNILWQRDAHNLDYALLAITTSYFFKKPSYWYFVHIVTVCWRKSSFNMCCMVLKVCCSYWTQHCHVMHCKEVIKRALGRQ